MCTVTPDGRRADVLRAPVPELFTELEERWAGEDPQRWKWLLALVAHEYAGWTLERIGLALGHHRGHVSRMIEKTKRELQEVLGERAAY